MKIDTNNGRSISIATGLSVHGYWVRNDDSWYYCSECDECFPKKETKSNFCPNCGAKMDMVPPEKVLKFDGATLLTVEDAAKLSKEQTMYYHWWWLKTPGFASDYAAVANSYGNIDTNGVDVRNEYGCVRPALKITNLGDSGYGVGDIFKIKEWTFLILSNGLAWLYDRDIRQCAFTEVEDTINDWYRNLLK